MAPTPAPVVTHTPTVGSYRLQEPQQVKPQEITVSAPAMVAQVPTFSYPPPQLIQVQAPAEFSYPIVQAPAKIEQPLPKIAAPVSTLDSLNKDELIKFLVAKLAKQGGADLEA